MYRPRIYAIKLAKKLGIKLRQAKPSLDVPSWNGESLAIHIDASSLLHEVAHWLLAPDRRRRFVGFGLGHEPTGMDCDAVVSFNAAEDEEMQASALGICYERALGMNWWDTAAEHQWVTCDHLFCTNCDGELGSGFARVLTKLNKRGLLNGWLPTIVL